MIRTKIIATVGPATENAARIEELVKAGVNVFRLNFAHGSQEEYTKIIARIRRIAKALKSPVAILADLSGPKIRCGDVGKEGILLSDGEEVTLSSSVRTSRSGKIPVLYHAFAKDVKKGERIYLADGAMALRITRVQNNDVVCLVESGGMLFSRKGINLPDTNVSAPALGRKDRADIRFAVESGIDWIGLSFVRSARDVAITKQYVKRFTDRPPPVIAKIEKRQAVERLEDIVKAADGIMVARGDLGVEIDLEEVPIVQKRIINMCNDKGKPVITATQMLESMINNYQPTRAEVTDIANAIFDGTDAVMLSGETAIGKYPVQSVRMMSRVAKSAEREIDYEALFRSKWKIMEQTVPEAISHAVCQITMDLDLDAIVCCTQYGSTARMVARYRPRCPIIAVSPDRATVNRLCLSWGVLPCTMRELSGKDRTDIERLIALSLRTTLKAGLVKKGWKVAITAGLPLHIPGTTNFIRVVTVRE